MTKLVVGIIVAGFVSACGIVAVDHWTHPGGHDRLRLESAFQRELDDAQKNPRDLARWLHHITETMDFMERRMMGRDKPTLDDFKKTGQIFGLSAETTVASVVFEPGLRSRFEDYLAARLDPHGPRGKEAWKRLEAAAALSPPPAFANEFMGDLLAADAQFKPALKAYLREGAAFDDARRARKNALGLALQLKDQAALRTMTAGGTAELSAHDQYEAGLLLGDWAMIARGFVRLEAAHARPDVIAFTLLAASLWYAVFVRMGPREPMRWLKPLPAVAAGVVSILPTLILLHVQETATGLVETGDPMNDMLFYVTGVGLREETAKLLLFALFLPWLLRSRVPGRALLTGAFVGLGFALDENRNYYLYEGVANVAVGRLLTANFFHAALTGLAGDALYELLRTRFGTAERFLLCFGGVVLAHGLYDWLQTAGARTTDSAGMLCILVLLMVAQQFFARLGGEVVRRQRSTVSLLALFLVGLAVILSSSFMSAAWETGTLAALGQVGADALGLVPITVFYVRQFNDV